MDYALVAERSGGLVVAGLRPGQGHVTRQRRVPMPHASNPSPLDATEKPAEREYLGILQSVRAVLNESPASSVRAPRCTASSPTRRG